MRIHIQKGGILDGEPAEADGISHVIVFSNDGDALVAIEQVGRDVVQITRAGEETFGTILRRLGVQAPVRTT